MMYKCSVYILGVVISLNHSLCTTLSTAWLGFGLSVWVRFGSMPGRSVDKSNTT